MIKEEVKSVYAELRSTIDSHYLSQVNKNILYEKVGGI